jgi:hypothetical protein
MFKKFKSSKPTVVPYWMKIVKRFEMVKTQSSDGEIHIILSELKLNDALNSTNGLNETKIREIMKKEAQKPLLLVREYE